MNKATIILILNLVYHLVNISHAQQRMQYTTQVQQGFIQNPALIGLESYHEVRLLYTQQWTGFTGSLKAKGIGYGTCINEDTTNNTSTLKTLALPGTKPKSLVLNKQQNISSKVKIGAGGIVLTEGDGTISINEYVGMVSFKFPLKTKSFVLGIGTGLIQHSFNPENIKLINSNDLTFSKQQKSVLMPTVQLSGLYLAPDFFICLNSKHIFKTKFGYDALEPNKKSELINYTTINGGLKFKLMDNSLTVIPTALIRIGKNTSSSIDICGTLDYKDFFKFGLLFRTNGDFASMLGITISQQYSILYSYDITTAQLRSLFSNTHNLLIAVRLKKNSLTNCTPKNFW